MGLLPIFTQAFVVGLSGAMAPGPLLTYNIQLSYKKGFWTGPRIVLGHAILEATLVLLLILGLGTFITLPITKVVIGSLGGLMLGWMGYELIWKESRKGIAGLTETAASLETAPSTAGATAFNPVLAGILVSLSNPYWSLWWAVAGLAMVTQAFTRGWAGVAVFYLGHICSDLFWYSLVSAAIVKGKRFLSNAAYRWLMIACGVFLLLIAGKFIYDAILTMGTMAAENGGVIELFKRKIIKI